MESPIKALKEFKFTKEFWKRALIALIGVTIMGITIGFMQAVSMLEYLVKSGLPAKEEAKRRIAHLKEKGGLR